MHRVPPVTTSAIRSGAALLVITAVGCAPAPPVAMSRPTVTHRAWSVAELASLAARLDTLRQAARIPGLSLAIVQDGQVVLAGGFGLASVAEGRAANETTPYNIASVSKPLSAVVAMRLVELGRLDLDRRMTSFTGFADFCEAAHTEGGIFFRDFNCMAPGLTLRRVMSMTGNGVPGHHFFYNPPAYSWASRPMAEVADTPFSALVSRYVFVPAGMDHSARIHRLLPLAPELSATLAVPYHLDSLGRVAVSPPPPPQGDGAAGGVISTVLDLARFDIALDAGRLISAASRTAMWTPSQGADGVAFPYGLGWFVRTVRGERLVWHSGLWEGAYSALYLKVPERGASLILLANSDGLQFPTPLDGATIETSPFAMAFLDAVTKP